MAELWVLFTSVIRQWFFQQSDSEVGFGPRGPNHTFHLKVTKPSAQTAHLYWVHTLLWTVTSVELKHRIIIYGHVLVDHMLMLPLIYLVVLIVIPCYRFLLVLCVIMLLCVYRLLLVRVLLLYFYV